MPKVDITADVLLMVLAVLVILAEVVSSLAKGRKSLREISGRERLEARISGVETEVLDLRRKEVEDHNRLDEGDASFQRVFRDTSQIMDVLDAMLMHFISGNDVEKLKAVKSELDHYKSKR